MGLLIKPPPIEYGDDCFWCTPARWAAGETPKRMLVYFENIVSCPLSHIPAPNGQIFILEQSPIAACTWQFNSDTYNCDFQPFIAMPNRSQLRLTDHHGFFFFTSTGAACPNEVVRYTNSLWSCAGLVAGHSGHAYLTWTKELNVIIESLGIDNVHGLRYEIRGINFVYHIDKLCSLYQRTNIKLKKIF